LALRFLFSFLSLSLPKMHLGLLTAGLLVVASTASAVAIHPRASPWAPAGPGEERSPCPALNTLANHGYINRSGKDLKVSDVTAALRSVYNVDEGFGGSLANTAILLTGNILRGTFSLGGLKAHNKIEHDASLSRSDIGAGEYIKLDPQVYGDLKKLADGGPITAEVLSKHRYARFQLAARRSNYTFGPPQWFLGYGESALALAGFGGPSHQIAPEVLDSFFVQEKIPDGWTKNPEALSLKSLTPILLDVYKLNPVPIQGLPAPQVIADVNCYLVKGLRNLPRYGEKLLGFFFTQLGLPVPACA